MPPLNSTLDRTQPSMEPRRLELKVVTSPSYPGWEMCYLCPNTGSFNSLTSLEASMMAELLSTMSGRRASIAAWFVTEDTRSLFRPEGARQLGKSDPTSSAVLWRYFKEPGELAEHLPSIWNGADGVRVYPVTDEADVERIVSPHFEDRSDDERLSLDYENKWWSSRTESAILGLLGALLHTLGFVARLLTSKRYRQELLDPFRQSHLTRIVESCGAYMEKGGHDDVHVLELMTSTSGVSERVAGLSRKLGLTTEVRGTV